jgi:hypothetical protein
MMHEGANMLKRHTYTAYFDFKGTFGGMDHIILFKITRELGFS